MDRQIAIYAGARIQALEYLVSNLYSLMYANMGLSLDEIKELQAMTLEKFAKHTVKGADAATSDHYAGELERAIQEHEARVLETLENMLQARRDG